MTAKKTWTVIIALLFLSSAPLAAAERNDEKRSDLWLKSKLVTAYTLNEHLNPFKLEVEVEDGVAHLRGTVDSDVERDLAVEIARGVEGIRKVREDIEVEPGAMSTQREESDFFRTVEDATLTARVKSKLLWNRNTNGLDINVTTRRGVVTLQGKVPTDAQGDLAVQLAKNTNGVMRVKDKLTVAPAPGAKKSKGAMKKMEEVASDAWISTKVRSTLLFSKEAEGAEIDVSTSGQVVTLKGIVTDEAQRDKIIDLVDDVVGVRDVRSQLAVAGK